ncbi:MAG: peptidylprolyl isomerase [Nitrospinaceae bacterium]
MSEPEKNPNPEQPPEEAKTPVYQRDKTAKEPRVAAPEGGKPPVKPKVKPRKVFVPKKVKAKTEKPMEHLTRHIVVSSLEAAEMIRKIVVDYQEELAAEAADNPDKVYQDYDKTEKFFKRLAKKFSTCPSRQVGGDLDWIYTGMPTPETLTPDVIDAILKTEKMSLPEPVKSKLGHHVILVCDTKISKRKAESKPEIDPRLTSMLERERSETRVPGKDMNIPS